MDNAQKTGQAWIYQIRVEGRLHKDWSGWFSGLSVSCEEADAATTTLTGALADQAALRGLLTKLWNLNLTVISVNRVESDPAGQD